MEKNPLTDLETTFTPFWLNSDWAIGSLMLAQDDSPASTLTGGGDNGETAGTQEPAGSNSTPAAGGAGKPQSAASSWLIFLPVGLLLIFMLWQGSSSQKKEKRKREEMLSSLNKHDKVQTIGGVIGSVIEVKDGEVILKVDEANNVKMRFSKSAIQQVVSEASAAE